MTMMGGDVVKLRSDDYRHFFRFKICREYVTDVADYLECEFLLPNTYAIDRYVKNDAYDDGVLLWFDMSKKSIRYIRPKTIADGTEYMSRALCVTNRTYLKCVTSMLADEHPDHIGLPVILSTFYDWCSVIVSAYSELRRVSDTEMPPARLPALFLSCSVPMNTSQTSYVWVDLLRKKQTVTRTMMIL